MHCLDAVLSQGVEDLKRLKPPRIKLQTPKSIDQVL